MIAKSTLSLQDTLFSEIEEETIRAVESIQIAKHIIQGKCMNFIAIRQDPLIESRFRE